jgi:hypothetical protein
VKAFDYDGSTLTQIPGQFIPFGTFFGVNVAAGANDVQSTVRNYHNQSVVDTNFIIECIHSIQD